VEQPKRGARGVHNTTTHSTFNPTAQSQSFLHKNSINAYSEIKNKLQLDSNALLNFQKTVVHMLGTVPAPPPLNAINIMSPEKL